MVGYEFGQDETVVLRTREVRVEGDAPRFRPTATGELMLTNKNIVFPRKSMFGKVKSYRVWPLSGIRVVDGVPQCRLDSSEFMAHKLEISFQDELVSFAFESLEAKREVRSWVNQISVLLVGREASEENLRATGVGAFTDVDSVAETFGTVLGSFGNAFARRRAKEAPVVSARCPSCNASVKGRRGSTVTCPYCESHITIA